MFVDAIERIKSFTRPIHSIARLHGYGPIVPGSATLFFINELGDALTCRHVAVNIERSAKINRNYKLYKGKEAEFRNHPDKARLQRDLQNQYGIKDDTIKQLHHAYINCVEGGDEPTIILHPSEHIDLAIVRFRNYARPLYTSYATFLKDSVRIRPGRTLCRLGFPFPEFSNFKYDGYTDDAVWTDEPPRYMSFPSDGMITRLLRNKGGITEIEMSTPGLVGQSGGPLFDTNGLIYGLQSATDQLHLGLDIEDKEVLVKNRRSRVSNYPFLQVGICVHVDRIKEFLRASDVKFYQA
ncbi:trypsin-like peptidase [Spirosoma oryzae]|uniref:Trypsin-like peptidase n=1 Tax=Spirosoma oryzae TaxID=1469603 RepID=A0A2T0SEA9_9BACT|nr:serine protease [Spirosoma oryzae]PRY31740.1 trypsin-like peptidase [Spirosoma oryzae]